MAQWVLMINTGGVCGIARYHPSFWALSELGRKAYRVGATSLVDWIKNVVDACMNGVFNATNAAEWAVKFLHDYQQVHPIGQSKSRRATAKWRNPPSGRLKVNVDGSYRPEFGDGGIGIVVRDDHGTCVAAMARYFPKVLSAFHMEAEPFKAGLLLAIYQGWDGFELESDCSLMVAALNQNMEDRSDVGRIIDDCKSYLTSLHSIQITHVFREANGVAHRLAHLASSAYLDDVWLDEAPVIIQDVLYENYCNLNRGQGSMSPSRYVLNSNIISQAWG
ncbi:uncharacterized protein LOC133711410 [Rosa rugosa]|uniref:uncharacterized protein LOC133711410 n=1 Tax=Rosa rugosa TaxID=74645 RepID=UPI002B41537B|nr:uncharacterized protein LOC133711410 [Rosa rugosa]